MTRYIENYKKNIVIDMRKKGYSYSEIQNSIHIPKSTIAFWLKDIKLTLLQSEKLKKKQLAVAKANSERKKIKNKNLADEIKKNAAKEVGDISKKELWLMGLMIYWRERLLLNNENDFKKGVNFTSSDPYLIKLFLKWLKDIGNIENDEIILDIFIKKSKGKNIEEIIAYWSDVTEFPENVFTHIYKQKKMTTKPIKNKKIIRKHGYYGGAKYGLLRVRVRSSSMLARQISGWMKGVYSRLL